MTIPDGYTVLRCNSHRARVRAGLSGRATMRSALYSFRRASTGGYYMVTELEALEILRRKVPGITRLRKPYDDLLRCWQ